MVHPPADTFHLLYEEHSISVPTLMHEGMNSNDGSKASSVAGEPNNFKAWLYNRFKRMVPAGAGGSGPAMNTTGMESGGQAGGVNAVAAVGAGL
jgi:hypothetical protein